MSGDEAWAACPSAKHIKEAVGCVAAGTKRDGRVGKTLFNELKYFASNLNDSVCVA